MILVILLPLFVCKYMLLYILQKRKIQKNINIIIIHKKINSNNHFTVPGLAEMEIGLDRKIGISQNWREHFTKY